jgi:hypothetical protein
MRSFRGLRARAKSGMKIYWPGRLNWGKDPQDLDAHLMTPIIEGKQYEVYWGEKGSSSEAPYAQLDVDDRNSFGPETITIARTFPGVYHYFVHNFGDEWTPPTGELTNSAAVVQIYTAAGLVETFHVPTDGAGRYWHVCTVDGTTLAVTPINKITNTPDLSGSGVGALSAAWTASEDGFERTIIPAMYQAQSARTRYLWDFGDGAISTEENPTKVYGAVGTYTVSLQVVTAQMWADTVIKTNFITVRSSLPVLSISRSGANVAIKWTTVQPGFGLESKASLNALSWWAVSQAPLVTGNSYTVTLPITGNQFFRLRKP